MAFTAPSDETLHPIPSVRFGTPADDTTFGGGPGLERQNAQVQKIAENVGEIATFEKVRADQTAIESAQAKASALTTEVLYHPQTGVMGSRGIDALNAQKEGLKKLQKGMNDLSQGLHGDAQIAAFNNWAVEQSAIANKTMASHADTQIREHDATMWGSLLENQAGAVATAHNDSDALAFHFRTVNENAVAFAQRNRLDKDQTDLFIQQANDTMHASVIDGMQKFQTDDSAQKYFDANKDSISPGAQKKIEVALEEGNTRARAIKAASDALKNNPDSEVGALAEVNKIDNPKVRDLARKKVTEDISQDRAARKNDQESSFMNALQMVNEKGLVDSAERRLAVPPMLFQKLSPQQQRTIESGGSQEVTSIKKWEEFTQSVTDGSIAKMSKAEINEKFMPFMTPTDQKTVADYWAGIKKNGSGGPKEKAYASVLQMQDDALVSIGALSPKNPTKVQLTFKKQFSDSVNRDLELEQNSLGRQLKQDEIRKIVDAHTLKALNTQSGRWFPSVSYDKIPDVDKQHIIALARNAGFTATKEHIEDAYKMHKQGKTDDEIMRNLR